MGACILYAGTIDHNGYGRKRVSGVLKLAHRIAYETFVGPIPSDLVVDHLCFVRACINPDHLRLATRAENAKRHKPECLCSCCRPDVARTRFCPNGHDKDALGRKSGGTCLVCQRKSNREYMRKKRSRVV